MSPRIYNTILSSEKLSPCLISKIICMSRKLSPRLISKIICMSKEPLTWSEKTSNLFLRELMFSCSKIKLFMLLIQMPFREVFASEVNSVESKNLFRFSSFRLEFQALQMVNLSQCFIIGKITSIFPVNATKEMASLFNRRNCSLYPVYLIAEIALYCRFI